MCIELNVFLFTDLEWKVVYVGSGENESFDQELDSVLVGPVPVGLNEFLFQVCIFIPSKDFHISYPTSSNT
jgi:hypothetical protein